MNSIVAVCGETSHKCGYCHSNSDTSKSFGIWAYSLEPKDYQSLIDIGWRRSGKYVYKPTMDDTCCPPYTIRLDAYGFELNKGQRKIINRFFKFLGAIDVHVKNLKELTELENKSFENHTFRTELKPACFESDTFALYKKYQTSVHSDKHEDINEKKFTGFLVDSPLRTEATIGGVSFGSFHERYFIDERLVAVAVLDVLPLCLSSVYFMYDPDYSFLELGKFSVLREIALTHQLHKSVETCHYYYMGYYIHNCQKMQYKMQYRPSFLLDPISRQWFPGEECSKLLENNKYCVFSGLDKQVDERNDLRLRILHNEKIYSIEHINEPSIAHDLKTFASIINRDLSTSLAVYL